MNKYRKMLSDMSIPAVDELFILIPTQSKTTVCTWVIEYSAKTLVPIWAKYYPEDTRPQAALAAARDWLDKKIKLPEAKKFILNCHEAARANDNNPTAQATARAIGQAASTIHACGHSIGIALYGALAVAYDELGIDAPWKELEQRAAGECGHILASLQSVAVENEPNPCKVSWKC